MLFLGLKTKSVLSVYAPMVFSQMITFLLASVKTLNNGEKFSSNPSHNAYCGNQEAACDSVNWIVSQR